VDPLDVAILVLRLALVAALYGFLLVVLRASRQTLAAPAARPELPSTAAADVLRLIVVDPGATGLHPGASLAVADGATFGRAPDADVRLVDATVSSNHARITLSPGGWAIDDLGSTNGTTVNGVRVYGRATISPGDEVALGTPRFRVDGEA